MYSQFFLIRAVFQERWPFNTPCVSGLLTAQTGGHGKFLRNSLYGNGGMEGCVLGSFSERNWVSSRLQQPEQVFHRYHKADIAVMISLITKAKSTLFYTESFGNFQKMCFWFGFENFSAGTVQVVIFHFFPKQFSWRWIDTDFVN